MLPAQQKRIEREEAILLSLKRLDFLTRSQIQQLHELKGIRNAQRVLKQMEPYVNTFRDVENIYFLNNKGREIVDCDKIRKRTFNVDHYLMRNDIFIEYGCPITWENEMRAISQGKSGKIVIVSDALFEIDKKYHIVEVDNTQKMKKNRVKIDKYRRLIERNAFKGMPRLIWVTTTVHRKNKLLELCEGLDVKCYLSTDFK